MTMHSLKEFFFSWFFSLFLSYFFLFIYFFIMRRYLNYLSIYLYLYSLICQCWYYIYILYIIYFGLCVSRHNGQTLVPKGTKTSGFAPGTLGMVLSPKHFGCWYPLMKKKGIQFFFHAKKKNQKKKTTNQQPKYY